MRENIFAPSDYFISKKFFPRNVTVHTFSMGTGAIHPSFSSSPIIALCYGTHATPDVQSRALPLIAEAQRVITALQQRKNPHGVPWAIDSSLRRCREARTVLNVSPLKCANTDVRENLCPLTEYSSASSLKVAVSRDPRAYRSGAHSRREAQAELRARRKSQPTLKASHLLCSRNGRLLTLTPP
jgi:hypothetical protein